MMALKQRRHLDSINALNGPPIVINILARRHSHRPAHLDSLRSAAVKRTLIVAFVCTATIATAGWLAFPRLYERVQDQGAAKNREANILPEAALQALTAPNLRLYSINPDHGCTDAPGTQTFHRWPVLGETMVASAKQREELSGILQHGLSRWTGKNMASCFSPRHALRATDGANTYDLLICFECGRLIYYPPNGKSQYLVVWTEPGAFNDLLVAAGIPLAKPPRGTK